MQNIIYEKEQSLLDDVIHASHDISSIKDLDILLERILFEARRFTKADAGSIYIRHNDHLEISYSQNNTLSKQKANEDKLIYSRFIIPLNHDTIAGYVGSTGEMVNIKDVYDMSQSNLPCKFNPQYDKISGYLTKSMLVLPIKDHRDRIQGVLQLINARDDSGHITVFSSQHESMALHFAYNASIAVERAMMTRSMIMRMIQMAELRDPKETGAHVNRVGAYSSVIYEKLAEQNNSVTNNINTTKDIIRMAAMLHDVGKVAIKDSILKKPDKLTKDEYDVMKAHTWLGAQLFIDKWSEFDEAAFDIALNHHERWDGKGYPGHIDVATGLPLDTLKGSNQTADGKKGDEIPLFARIVSVADVYDALSSERSYKKAWQKDKVIQIIKDESGKQFDPEVVAAMMAILDDLDIIAAHYPDK